MMRISPNFSFTPRLPLSFRLMSVLLSATLLGPLLTLTGCGADVDAHAAAPVVHQAVAVRTTEVRVSGVGEPLRFAGVVQPRERAMLTFQVGGVLRERPVELGQAVVPGQLLARLFNPEIDPAREVASARVNEVLAQTEQARRDADRAAQLHERGMLSEQARDQQVSHLSALRASLESARAALRQSEQLQREMRLEAPFAGTVEAVLIESGEYVAPGQPVLRLSGDSGYEVEVRVPVSMLEELNIGDRLPVWGSLNGSIGQGRVTEIGRSASQGSVLYPLVVSLDDTQVRAGDAVEIGLLPTYPERAAVPFSAVMRSAEGLSVFRLEGDRVRRVAVEVAGLKGDLALLVGDSLQAGDRVVHSGLTRLADNDFVRPLP